MNWRSWFNIIIGHHKAMQLVLIEIVPNFFILPRSGLVIFMFLM